MNVILWILQIILAIHTLMGAVWKFSNSEQTIEAFKVIPHYIWISMSITEILCTLILILVIFIKSLGKLVPLAGIFIVFEMLLYIALSLYYGGDDTGEIVYWVVVAAITSFFAYSRYSLKPL